METQRVFIAPLFPVDRFAPGEASAIPTESPLIAARIDTTSLLAIVYSAITQARFARMDSVKTVLVGKDAFPEIISNLHEIPQEVIETIYLRLGDIQGARVMLVGWMRTSAVVLPDALV